MSERVPRIEGLECGCGYIAADARAFHKHLEETHGATPGSAWEFRYVAPEKSAFTWLKRPGKQAVEPNGP